MSAAPWLTATYAARARSMIAPTDELRRRRAELEKSIDERRRLRREWVRKGGREATAAIATIDMLIYHDLAELRGIATALKTTLSHAG